MNTIRIFLALLLALTILQGCSKSSSSSSSSGPANGAVRLVNATNVNAIPAYPSLDMTTSGTTLATAIPIGGASTYYGLAPGAYTFALDVSGTGIASAQQALLITSGVDYALVAHTGGGQLQLTSLTEIEPAPATGDTKIRVSNLAMQDAGSVDVYMAGPGGTLAGASALATNVSGTSPYFEIPVGTGTYQIWVTGAGNRTDVRLTLPSVAVSNQQIQTLVLTAAAPTVTAGGVTGTAGGVLVDGWLVTQQAAVVPQTNTYARVRVTADITGGGPITVTANGTGLDAATLVSPAVDSYVSVLLNPAGTPLSGTAVVNGAPFPLPVQPTAPGADWTLLAVGTIAAPQFYWLRDDNRLPLNGLAKLRLVSGVNGLAGNLSLTADANLMASNVAFGTASAPSTFTTTGNISQLQVNRAGNAPLGGPYPITLQSQGVYSVFMLGDYTALPQVLVGIVRADR